MIRPGFNRHEADHVKSLYDYFPLCKLAGAVIFGATGAPVSVKAQLACCIPTLSADFTVDQSETSILR
jgi:hypothetical protein